MNIRVSVANLTISIRAYGHSESHRVGILSPGALKKGIKRIQALGGGAHLTLAGVEHLVEQFGATDFEKDGDAIDARFVVDDRYLESVLSFFETPNEEYFETSPHRELRDELTEAGGVLIELQPVHGRGLAFTRIDCVRQAPPLGGKGTSLREKEGIPTRRLFHRFEIVVPPSVFRLLLVSPGIFWLTDEELATTKGGICKGMNKTGLEMADNLF